MFEIKNKDALRAMSDPDKAKSLFKQVKVALMMPDIISNQMSKVLMQKHAFDNKLPSAVLDGMIQSGLQQCALKVAKAVTPESEHAKFTTPSASPILTTATGLVTEWWHEMPTYDMSYTGFFDLVDLRGTNQDSFKINTTSTGVTWVQKKVGERVDVHREFLAAESSVGYLMFKSGIGIQDEWLQFNQFYRVEEVVNDFINAAHVKRCSLHYGLITALSSGIDQTWDTDLATTFNAACSAIVQGLKGKIPLGTAPQFDILVDTARVGKVLAMLEATRGSMMLAFGTQKQPIAYSIRNVIVSAEIPVNGSGFYVILPGKKMKRGLWMDMKVESARDIYHSATDWVGKEQYNAVIGETGQIRRVPFAAP